jgi:hypothetical protein
VILYREALELLEDGDSRRRQIVGRLAVAVQAVYHLGDVSGGPVS